MFETNVLDVILEAPGVKTVRISTAVKPDFTYLPGQFIMLHVMAEHNKEGWKKIPRAYSISSSPTQKGFVDVTVGKKEGGWISHILCDQINKNDKISFMGPFGKFIFDEKTMPCVTLIGGGLGITPLMGIARYIRDKKLSTRVTFIYSAKTEEDIIFRREIEQLKESPNFNVQITLTREGQKPNSAWKGLQGRIDKEKLAACVNPGENPVVFVCGTPDFARNAKALLIGSGVKADAIHVEAW